MKAKAGDLGLCFMVVCTANFKNSEKGVASAASADPAFGEHYSTLRTLSLLGNGG